MTTTKEIGHLLDAFNANFDKLIALTDARAKELGIDNTVTPVPVGPEHTEILAAHEAYEASWKELSTAMDAWMAQEPAQSDSAGDEDRVHKIDEVTRQRIASTKPKTLATEQQIADDAAYGYVEPND
ncbi:hypothetical protein [Arthrobacter sp. HS15c]|uniref:hypothetical protein n=1 Tax=Arthrobacter sp. HS15c TaxID=3230279 RepID=UPI003466384A